jgi:trehalose 6-phosphate synthase/phosphatase
MNTTSMEFILCQDKTNKSPLVLSEFMGTATSFQSALTINPHDLLGTAEAINKGLTMPQSEREERHAQLFESIQGHTSHTWAATILRQLLENVGGEHTAHQTPALDLGRFKSGYKQAKKRLMLFDYDVGVVFLRATTALADSGYRARSLPSSRSRRRLSRLIAHERRFRVSRKTPRTSSTSSLVGTVTSSSSIGGMSPTSVCRRNTEASSRAPERRTLSI